MVGGKQSELARLIGRRPQEIWNWLNRGDEIAAEACTAIELATNGAVTRRDLRPDDWARIWPELATHKHSEVKGAACEG